MRNYAMLGAATLALGLTASAHATVYNGNGATGFGGSIGNGALTVTDGGSTINFSLATSGFNGNGLAIYLDTVAGGFNDTSSFVDTGDGGRRVLSGDGANGRTTVTFAPGFTADYGISVEPGTFAGLFSLAPTTQSPNNFTFVASAGLDTNATTTLNFSVNKADIGLPASGGGFNFVASLTSTDPYRSNETIGTSVTTVDPTNTGTAPNAGFTGSQAFSNFDTFGTVSTPEPASLAVLGLGAVGLLRRRK